MPLPYTPPSTRFPAHHNQPLGKTYIAGTSASSRPSPPLPPLRYPYPNLPPHVHPRLARLHCHTRLVYWTQTSCRRRAPTNLTDTLCTYTPTQLTDTLQHTNRCSTLCTGHTDVVHLHTPIANRTRANTPTGALPSAEDTH